MSFIEKVSLSLAERLGNRLDKNEEEVAVLNYGLFFIIQTCTAIILTFIIGLIFKMVTEIMVISITASLLKRYSGGVHSSSPNRCILSGLILSIILSFACKGIADSITYSNLVILVVISLILSGIILYKKCPVPSKNKPLKKESTRKKLRKKAFKLMGIYFVLSISLLIVYKITNIFLIKIIIVSIILGVLLQIFSISKVGEIGMKCFEMAFDVANLK